MDDHPAHASSEVAAIETLGQVIGDLVRIAERLPVPGGQAAEIARILDHLAAELGEAAAMIRRGAGVPAPDPGPGVAQPGGGWLSGPSRS